MLQASFASEKQCLLWITTKNIIIGQPTESTNETVSGIHENSLPSGNFTGRQIGENGQFKKRQQSLN